MATSKKNPDIFILLNILPYLWPKHDRWLRVRVVISLVALVLGKSMTVLTPLFMIWTVDSLAKQPDNEQPFLMMAIGTVGLVIAYGLIRLFSVGFNQLRDAIFVVVGQSALRKLAIRTFAHIHNLSLSFHLERKTGALSRIIERGVKGVDFLLRFLLFSIFPLFLELVFVIILLITRYDYTYALVVLFTITIYVWVTFRITNWRLNIRRVMIARDTEANQRAIDSLINFETVKYFTAELKESTRYDYSMKGYETAAIKTGISLALLNFVQALLISTGLVSVMIMAAIGVIDEKLTLGEFVGINTIMLQLILPLNFLGTVYREIRQSLVDMAAMFQLLDQPIDVADKPNVGALKLGNGQVHFRDVGFQYELNSRKILTNLSFVVQSGQTVAIVGSSGAGKSTIARLLFRFFDVTDGSILIDGQDIRDVTQDSIRRNIGVVPQDTVLFNDTIGYNIAYGNPDASQDEVQEAAKAAQLSDLIKTLPDGYNTIVGERGLKLSGGEKQRVGIARAFIKNPKILLLDEATSALDSKTEKGILDSVQSVGKGRTVIIIAHRLSTVLHADNIIVLDKGKIVEQGNHKELLCLNSYYSKMWSRQQQ